MQDSWLLKYRPKSFDEVIGQDAAVAALANAVKRKSGHTFLFTGPSGTGKTTLARLTAEAVGCLSRDIIETDAATDTGIDDMRAVTAGLMYKPLGVGSVKGVIVDEFHALSKNAVQSLLKVLEEPPAHVYWFLCTTEPTKVPEAIRTRCLRFDLKPVPSGILAALLDVVAEAEGLKTAEGVVGLCAKEANGSPRQALANLAICADVKSRAEAAELLRSAEDVPGAFQLAQALVRGAKWSEVQELLGGLKDVSPEGVRHVVRAYVTKVVLGAKSEASAGRGMEILDAFSEPFNSHDGVTPVVLACGRILLS